ncbi:MAG: isoprenylcysteine carboxylmethyltransferase family protein [Gammaproteobacteria bacterium]|nr:isoprenylcysteine carboxylmethyltransferase family protein [Gammaproteobacteria bacterium]
MPKLLPIAYVIIFAVLMYVAAVVTDTLDISLATHWPVIVAIFVAGTLIILIGGYQFKAASTTVNPLRPEESTQLVTTGIYQFSRNPMYVGFFLFLLAWAVLLGSLMVVLVLPLFILLITKVQILPEEEVLQRKFGENYINYKGRVRRWV